VKKIFVIIAGATATGKTQLAIDVAKHYRTDVISADSRQFFREMQIGTARPTLTEMREVTHHLVGHLSIVQPYHVADFERDALQIANRLFQDKNIVVVAGGSGLYLKALAEGIDEMPAISPIIRQELIALYQQQGLAPLLQELSQMDYAYFQEADKANHQRIIRALEVCRATGKPFSSFRSGKKIQRPFHIIKIGLYREREELYNRINQRVDMMIEEGLKEEALSLIEYRHLNALQTVGYKEIYDWKDGLYDWQECVRLIKQNTRHFAKRQLTWFNRDKEIIWIKPENYQKIIETIDRQITNP